jgi:hypothetical protein
MCSVEVIKSPNGTEHAFVKGMGITSATENEFRDNLAKNGKPILVYFLLAHPERQWKSWIRSIEDIRELYQEVHIVVQCRELTPDLDEGKDVLARQFPSMIFHVFGDAPEQNEDDTKQETARGHAKLWKGDECELRGDLTTDPWCGEYRGIKTLYDVAKDNPDSIMAYGHSKGISYHKTVGESTCDPTISGCYDFLKRPSRALDAFALFPQVSTAGIASMARSSDLTKKIWFNFYMARADIIIKSGEPKKTIYRHYYEWDYITNSNDDGNNLSYNTRSCCCANTFPTQGENCCIRCRGSDERKLSSSEIFPNIGLYFYPGDDHYESDTGELFVVADKKIMMKS